MKKALHALLSFALLGTIAFGMFALSACSPSENTNTPQAECYGSDLPATN